MDSILRRVALAAGLFFAGSAHVVAAEAEPLVQGNYFIEVYRRSADALFYYGCMIVGQSGQAETPSLYDWKSGPGPCGLPASLKQAQWEVYAVTGRDVAGQTRLVHVIKSRENGKCLIRGASGTAPNASLHSWNDSPNVAYCGLANADQLVSNGQAAWNLGAVTRGVDQGGLSYFNGPMTQANAQPAYLTFVPTPRTAPSTTPDFSLATFSASSPDGWELRFRTWPVTAQQ